MINMPDPDPSEWLDLVPGSSKAIGTMKVFCPCGWKGVVPDAIPDVDGDGNLGCPDCKSVLKFGD